MMGIPHRLMPETIFIIRFKYPRSDIIRMTIVQFNINEEDDKKIEFLKKFAKSRARTKVFKFCLNKTWDIYKDMK
jgi:hypothetical protein